MTRTIFVFGSNKAGRHGRGAALFALRHKRAVYGKGTGIQGRSYAIPTKGYNLEVLSLAEIKEGIDKFISFAEAHPELEFEITKIGCGLAGYNWNKEVRPLFPGKLPVNCKFI